jgi:hypothetical protein
MVSFKGNPSFVPDQYEFGNNLLYTECAEGSGKSKKWAESDVSPMQFHRIELRRD